jgi:hypothetical protein
MNVPDSLPPLPDSRILAAPVPAARSPHLAVLRAFVGLLYVDLTLRMFGYRLLRRRLAFSATRSTPRAVIPNDVAGVLAAVDEAAVYYPRRAMCLERSAVATWMLRRCGIQAQMVIGCRHTPFYAHAWVEVDGSVVNDKAAVKDLYPEMERI